MADGDADVMPNESARRRIMHAMPDAASHVSSAVDARARASMPFAKRESEQALLGRIGELEQALRDRDEFLAVLAHELRNPLAPIRSVAEIVRKVAHSDANLAKASDVLERQVAHMCRLVDDLLDTARLRWGRFILESENVDVASVLSGAIETMQPRVAAKRHSLAVDLPNETLPVHGDPTRLAQVFCNLLDNAVKYTPDGGMIEVNALRDGDVVVVGIRDTGVGIPAPMLTAIFDLFTQVKPARDCSRGGLGLGLSLVKTIVEMHEGSVEARSDGPGRGSEFVVKLPASPKANEKGRSSTGQRPRRQRVLVVDDDACQALCMMLELLGHETSVAHDADAALTAASRRCPDLVLLDIGLRGTDGYEIARRLRRIPECASVRVAALTGYDRTEDRLRAVEAGFDAYIVKPVDFDSLTRLVG
ncbi:MAG TPA: ATP-binding protein [Casimicrobiaceae bacterium]|nr:ATP-binding protein [Casimicrobiaceae bacterium]